MSPSYDYLKVCDDSPAGRVFLLQLCRAAGKQLHKVRNQLRKVRTIPRRNPSEWKLTLGLPPHKLRSILHGQPSEVWLDIFPQQSVTLP